jgi:hypothetical protein
MKGTLLEDKYFCHGANKLEPQKAETLGINPMYAEDVAVDEAGRQLGSGKMVYTFVAQQVGSIFKPLTKHKDLWASKYYFVFLAPAGTEIWCQGGVASGGTKEVAFPYIVEPADIRWVYDKSYSPVAFNPQPSPTARWGY